MHVAYVCADPGVPVFGCKGASIHVQEVLRALTQRGVQVELFATRFGGVEPAGLARIPIHPLPPIPKGNLATREMAALAANQGLRTALEREGPFDFVYERHSLWSFAGMDYARAHGIPGLLEVNAPLIEEQAQHRGLTHRAAAEQVAARAFGKASVLLAVSEGVAAYLERQPAAQGRTYVVPNGVDPNRFRPGIAPAWPSDSRLFTVGFVGTLKPWHGLDVLIEAFAILHRQDANVQLLVVGHGPERERLTARLEAYGLSGATHFTGAVAPDEVPSWVVSMDVAVAPYPNIERFYFSPLKLYEYMAAGVPVVASRIGQVASVIEDGVNGILCPPGEAPALATALRRLQASAELRARLGPAGRATVLRHHTWDAVATQILQLARQSGVVREQSDTRAKRHESATVAGRRSVLDHASTPVRNRPGGES